MKKFTVLFSTKRHGRLQADALDMYHWLAIRNKKIANEFWDKMEEIKKDFESRFKELDKEK